jgi:hypothetical protein
LNKGNTILLRGKYDVFIYVAWNCFDQSNFYISRINIIEWNNICYTFQNSDLEHIQKLIRSVNSDVSFFLADKGEITRSMDIDAVLSETDFQERSKVRARHLLYPGW